jgi:hypothetical protein
MTPEQTALIRTSFDAMWSSRRRLAELFYDRFFELAPEARASTSASEASVRPGSAAVLTP